jgi:hypothetical protein
MAAATGPLVVASPNGTAQIRIERDGSRFTITRRGETVIAASQGGRSERVSLRFLPAGRYRATVWEDGATPNELRRVERVVTAADVLSLRLAPSGGAAVVLEAAR